MENNRRNFIKSISAAGGLSVLGGSTLSAMWQNEDRDGVQVSAEGVLKIIKPTHKASYKPLEEISIESGSKGRILVLDGWGLEYGRYPIKSSAAFTIGGAPGTHLIILEDQEQRLIDICSFTVGCKTVINDQGGKYREILDMLYWTMVKNWSKTQVTRFDGKFYEYFVLWLRDHVHTMKGMKYFYNDLKSGIDLYADSQRDDGMIWDNFYPRTREGNFYDDYFAYGDFIRPVENHNYEFRRMPVEADVEYLFLEGLYYTWKATGDDVWMSSRLDNALKALKYCTSDPYRWSGKFQLVKRALTIDTWDFQCNEDKEITGMNMVVDKDKTPFGMMFGDNTGLAAGCSYLSEMLEYSGRHEEAKEVEAFGLGVRKRCDEIAWNGRFYTHHVPEDKGLVRDFGVDQSSQLSLSNAYSLNRDLPQEKCAAIIRSYQKIREEMPDSSPGEWYTIFPPFERGWHLNKWDYMNGGVTPIVAGELAHGAFENGFESYGVDILERLKILSESTDNYLHCTYRGANPGPPEREFTPVDLSNVVNADISGDGAENVPGWTAEGDNDLREFPVGKQEFQGVPFQITDPAQNGRRACLGLSNDPEYLQEVRVDIGSKAETIYILHTANRSSNVGSVFLSYADGSEYHEYIEQGKIGNWWYPQDPSYEGRMPNCKVGWRGKNARSGNVGAYIYGMSNPSPEKQVEKIRFQISRSDAKWMILGITICDHPVYFHRRPESFGIPDNWGAAAVVYALVEGLAGVKDTGVSFRRATLSPRWEAAGVREVSATVKYEASGGYLAYRYIYDQDKAQIRLSFTGTSKDTLVEILLPQGKSALTTELNGQKVKAEKKRVEQSVYSIIKVNRYGVNELVVDLV